MKSPELFHPSLQRLLLVRLRSIGDTVLMTPCLTALRAWSSTLEIDVLVEPLSAPVLQGHPLVNRLYILPRSFKARMRIVSELRSRRYDLAFNLHGGTTGTFLTLLSGAEHTVTYSANQYSFLLKHRAPNPDQIWAKEDIHCVEQQLGLLKWAGLPVSTPPASFLKTSSEATASIKAMLKRHNVAQYVVVHPAAAFESKQWATERFAGLIEHLYQNYGLCAVVAVAPNERAIAEHVVGLVRTPSLLCADLSLVELMALIDAARLFVGNDSGPAHIAAALGKPLLVIFGSSNPRVWHPWSQAPYRLLRAELPCSPCPGHFCPEFGRPECIRQVLLEDALRAVDELLESSA